MNKLTQLLIFLITIMFVSGLARAETVLVIVNQSNTQELTNKDVTDIYQDMVNRWKGDKVIHIYELPVRSKIREKYYQNILQISARVSASNWSNRKISNSLKNILPKTKRESSVVRAVARDANAIGYVSERAVEGREGIRIALRIE